MLKRLSHIAACLLLVLLPLQGIAAANMSVCNSMSDIPKNSPQENKPCHESMAEMVKVDTSIHAHTESSSDSSRKTTCATLCASMCAMTALTSDLKSQTLQISSQIFSPAYQSYTSITLPNPQRPPIQLS